jgi:hypothetical protein
MGLTMAWIALRAEILREFGRFDVRNEDLIAKSQSRLTARRRERERERGRRRYRQLRQLPGFLEHQRQRAKAYRERHKHDPTYLDRKRINARRYYEQHREEICAYFKARYAKKRQDPEWLAATNARIAEWKRANKGKVAVWSRNHYARIMADPVRAQALREKKRKRAKTRDPEVLKQNKRLYLERVKADPVKSAAQREVTRQRNRRYYLEHRDEILAKKKAEAESKRSKKPEEMPQMEAA